MESKKLADLVTENATKKPDAYIQPSRMADLVRMAQEVTEIFSKADPGISYREMRIVLNIAMCAVLEAVGLNIDRR